MAPATVVPSAHCCVGAPQRLSVIVLVARIQRAESVYFMQTLFSAANLQRFSPRYQLCIVELDKALVLFIRSPAIVCFIAHPASTPVSTCSRRRSDVNSKPRDTFAVCLSLQPSQAKRRLPEPEDPADKSDCDTDPRQRRARERRRCAHAWHTSPFDLMAIPRM